MKDGKTCRHFSAMPPMHGSCAKGINPRELDEMTEAVSGGK